MYANLRRINNHRHPLLTMRQLRAIDPNRQRIIDLHHKLHRPRPRTQRLETREETITGDGMAGVREAALGDGVVFGVVAEGEGVANVGGEGGRVESEGAVADGDGDVGGEGEGEEGEEGGCECLVHFQDGLNGMTGGNGVGNGVGENKTRCGKGKKWLKMSQKQRPSLTYTYLLLTPDIKYFQGAQPGDDMTVHRNPNQKKVKNSRSPSTL